MANLQDNELVTGECRLSYTNLLEAKQINGKGDAHYSVSILIRKDDKETLARLTKARDAARANGVTEGKKPFASMSPAKLATMSVSLKDGDKDRPDNPECAGCWVLNAKTPANKPPGVMAFVDGVKESVKPGGLNVTEIYSGMYGHVHLQLFPYDTAGNQGIGASLQNVIKTRDGEPLGGSRKKAEDVFGDMSSPFETAAPATEGSPL